jgi:hypothetical protein
MAFIDLSDDKSTFYIHELRFRDVSDHCDIDKARTWIDDHKNDLKTEEQKRVAEARYPDCDLDFTLRIIEKTSNQLERLRRKAKRNSEKGNA